MSARAFRMKRQRKCAKPGGTSECERRTPIFSLEKSLFRDILFIMEEILVVRKLGGG